MLNWHTLSQFLGILAYKSVWLYCYWTKYASSHVTGILWFVSSRDSYLFIEQKNKPRDFVVSPTRKKENKTEIRGTASAVAAAFPILTAVALAVVFVAAAAIARVPL